MKSTAILCILIFFSGNVNADLIPSSGDVNAKGKLRKRISRLWPFAATKTHQLEKQRKRQLAEKMTSLGNLELVVFDLELRDHTGNIDALEEMAQLTRKEIYQRIEKNGPEEILVPLLQIQSNSIVNAKKEAPYFFEILQKATHGKLLRYDRELQVRNLLFANIENILALEPGPKQLQGLIEAIPLVDSINMSIKILQTILEEGKSADQFFMAFESTVPIVLKDWQYTGKDALKQFFADNAQAIGELDFSPRQIKSIDQCFNDIETAIILLQGGLKRARGDADKFAAFFSAIAIKGPSEKYRNALSKFFQDNAEEIRKLPFSASNKIERIGRYVDRAEASVVLLKGGLKHMRGNTGKFPALFDSIAHRNGPSDKYRNALSKFFVDNAEEIMDSGLSTGQIKRLNDYIDSIPTSLKILELALKKAEYAGDFFNIFHLVAPNPPQSEFQHIYGHFLMAHAEIIVDLDPSTAQMEKLDRYLPSPSTLFDMAKNRRRKKKKIKNKAVCAASAAALLSLSTLPETTE